MFKRILVAILLLLITGCTTYTEEDKDINLTIKTIGIDNKVNVSKITEKIEGIVMFYEYGRPNIENSNTVIGAHSGFGKNSYFNLINRLKEEDEIILKFDGIEYLYKVEKVYDVEEDDVSVLNNKDYNLITLITCNIWNSDMRTIVIARLDSII